MIEYRLGWYVHVCMFGSNSSQLNEMKYEGATNVPDEIVWEWVVNKEHEQMMKHKVWRPVKKYAVPKG